MNLVNGSRLAPWQRNASLTGISLSRPPPISFRPPSSPQIKKPLQKRPPLPAASPFTFTSHRRMLNIGSALLLIFILMLRTDLLHNIPSRHNTYKILLVINNRYKILPHSLVQQIFHIRVHTHRRIICPPLERSDRNFLRSL